MAATHQLDNDQSKIWNGAAGRAWVDTQEILDRIFKPLEDLLVAAVLASQGRRVLDVGCGTGSTILAVARSLGTRGNCVGIDISDPMIALARARAARKSVPAKFIVADAQDHAFEPGGFDMIISRFGVMFFDDPIAAFANLRRAASDNAELRLIAWRSPAENPFMTTAERAAAPLLPNIPSRHADAPGQFAFADPHRVQRVLEESGWSAIDIKPLDVACGLSEEELNTYLRRLGPLGRVLEDTEEPLRTQVIRTVRAAFDPYVRGDEVRFEAALWMVGARASAGLT